MSPGGLQRGAQRMTRRTKSKRRGRRISMRKVDWLPVRPLWAPRRATSKFQSQPGIQVMWQQVHLETRCEFIWAGGGFLAPNVKGQHLLNLGPQLFKHTYSAQEENKTKGQLQSPGAIKSQTATQTPATKYKTPTLQKGEANTASQPALSLLQKDGPHHVLLAPSVYAEVKRSRKIKIDVRIQIFRLIRKLHWAARQRTAKSTPQSYITSNRSTICIMITKNLWLQPWRLQIKVSQVVKGSRLRAERNKFLPA